MQTVSGFNMLQRRNFFMQNDTIRRAGKIIYLGVDEIEPSPNQPRRIFSEIQLKELAQSIKENGILQPLTVRRGKTGQWQLVAGERRLRAARLAEIKKVPCIEISTSDDQAAVLTLIENLQRSDLSFFQEAAALLNLMRITGYSQEQIAAKIGKSQSAVANKLRLLKLEKPICRRIEEAGLTERHARALLTAEASSRQAVLEHIIANGLNVEQSERYIKNLNTDQKPKRKYIPIVKDVRIFINTINHAMEVMKSSGINASSQRNDHDGYIEYVIRIEAGKKAVSTGKVAN